MGTSARHLTLLACLTCAAPAGEHCIPKHLSHCIGSVNHQLLFCPLSHMPSTGNDANVELVWDNSMKSKSIEDVLGMPLGSITAHLVAMQNVEVGSQVSLMQGYQGLYTTIHILLI